MKLRVRVLLALASALLLPLYALAAVDFQQPHTLSARGAGPSVLADLNGDGHLDIIATSGALNYIYVFLGRGDGSFERLAPNTSVQAPLNLIAADFNGDGKPDLAVTSGVGRQLSVLLGNGDGSFQPPTVQGTATGQLAVGDFNGDGVVDLAAPDSLALDVYLGNGDGSLRLATSFPLVVTSNVAIADFTATAKLTFPSPAFSGWATETAPSRKAAPTRPGACLL